MTQDNMTLLPATTYSILGIFTFNSLASEALTDVNRSKVGFQDIASPILEGIIDLDDHIIFFLIIVLIIVLYLIFEGFSKYVNIDMKEFIRQRKILSDDMLELL